MIEIIATHRERMFGWAVGKIMQKKSVAADRLFYTSVFVFVFHAVNSNQGNHYKMKSQM